MSSLARTGSLALWRRSSVAIVAVIVIAGGVLAATVLLRRSDVRRRLRRLLRGPAGRLDPLRQALLGVDQQSVASILGRPRAVHDQTWYYPIDPRSKLALVIQFMHGIARQTQLLRGPTRRR